MRCLGCFGSGVPAVDDHGPGFGIFSLFSIHLSEEAEDTARLLRDAMVRPAEVLVVPNSTSKFWLRRRKKKKVNISEYSCKAVGIYLDTLGFGGYLVHRSNLQNSHFIIRSFPL